MNNNWSGSKVDRHELSVDCLDDVRKDRDYWLQKSPDERLAALETLRQVIYGYDPANSRLQRVLEIAELGAS